MTNLARRATATDTGLTGTRSTLLETTHDARDRGRDAATPSSSSPHEGERLLKIYAGKLFDPYTMELLPQIVVSVSRTMGLVVDVRSWTQEELHATDFSDTENTVDLRGATVLPGFVDAHVHSASPAFRASSLRLRLRAGIFPVRACGGQHE